MVFGKKRPPRRVSERLYEWQPCFAWRPMQLIDGRWVLFERLEKISYMAPEVPAGVPWSTFGTWCFRLRSTHPATDADLREGREG